MGEMTEMGRLQDCICSWVAEPIEVKYSHEALMEIGDWSEARDTTISYVRAMVHHINPQCPAHNWLLNPIGYVGKPLPKVSQIAVDVVPLANRPSDKVFIGGEDQGGYEMLVEQGGVMGRVAIPTDSGAPAFGRGTYTQLTKEQAEAMLEGFMDEYGEKMKWVMKLAAALTDEDRARIKYEARKASEWYFVMAHPDGYGHCRSCHHDCRFEDHIDAQGNTYRCEEPTCGHTAGCPGC